MSTKRGLGRGLGALIPTEATTETAEVRVDRPRDVFFGGDSARTSEVELVPVPGARFAQLDVASIIPNPRQPRAIFDEDALSELIGSIKEIGVLQPVVVRQAGDGYELITQFLIRS